MSGRVRALWKAGWPFASLCILAASRWLLEGASPQLASSGWTEAAGCLLAAGLAAATWGRRWGAADRNGFRWFNSLAACVILTGPALAADVSSRFVNSDAATLALSLTSVVAAVALPAFGRTDGDLIARLWPGLAGLAGLLLLLPQPSLNDWRYDLALVSMPLLSGLAAAYLSREEATRPDAATPAGKTAGRGGMWTVAFLLAAAVFGALQLQALRGGDQASFSLGAAVLDGLGSYLTLRVLSRLGGMRWSAQFLLVPLVTMLEGVVFLRPVLDWRSWLALFLLTISGAYLLWGE